ncbi:hypothetical protein BOTBODRAFT_34885 [Botryobasidium botryosum FD-172 SS1]|uniref:Cytochrome P450 n=1 Tax=Botryobasidium botryosum (strain FD-172 SS1) TaxID=930990 RepID=A0A067MKD1_BOTB1|nr:hypothetical protein BOTBODRAFT_34885 [Botryobasidium botryosum FD-172 SS1]
MDSQYPLPLLSLVAAAATLALLYYSVFRSHSNPKNLPLPPGPAPVPILGNSRQIPSRPWHKYTEWGKIYGEIIHVRTMANRFIVLNSFQAAKDVIERSVCSDRYRPVMMDSDLVGWDKAIGMIHYGEQWRTYRKVLQPYMHKNAMKQFASLQEKGTHLYLKSLLTAPEDFIDNIKWKTAKETLAAAYGAHAADMNSVTISEVAMGVFIRASNPNNFLVNTIPQLRYIPSWFPGAEFKRFAKEGNKKYLRMVNTPFEKVKAAMTAGTATSSIASDLLEERHDEGIVKAVAGSIYLAGTHTTVSTLMAFMFAMVLHPEVVKKAQAELDSVVGNKRLPESQDCDKLPYLDAVIKEVMRYVPVLPLGLPHRLMEDDEYKGYFLPGNSVVYPNVWAISRDETIYEEPEKFRPERFLVPGKDVLDPNLYVFGLGRRICIGRYFANSTIYLAAASILATFDISKARDENGREITPEMELEGGTLVRVAPFKCSIKPRSPAAAELVRSAAGSVDDLTA